MCVCVCVCVCMCECVCECVWYNVAFKHLRSYHDGACL